MYPLEDPVDFDFRISVSRLEIIRNLPENHKLSLFPYRDFLKMPILVKEGLYYLFSFLFRYNISVIHHRSRAVRLTQLILRLLFHLISHLNNSIIARNALACRSFSRSLNR